MAAFAMILCALGFIGLIWGGFQKLKAGRLAKAPFVSTGEVADGGEAVAVPKGALSVEGEVKCDNPLTSPVTGTPCLYYELKVEGSWKDGDTKKSKNYIDEKVAAPFVIDDGSGAVSIDASQGGDFEPFEKMFEETKKEGFFADLKSAVGKGKPIVFGDYEFDNPPMSKANKFTCTERVLKVQPQLFVLGKHEDGVITAPKWTSLILSSKSRNELLGSTAKTAKNFLIGGAAATGIGLIFGIISAVTGPSTAEAANRAPEPTQIEASADAAEANAVIEEAPAPVKKASRICQKAIKCCNVATGGADSCDALLEANKRTCKKSLKSFRKAVKKSKPRKISACR